MMRRDHIPSPVVSRVCRCGWRYRPGDKALACREQECQRKHEHDPERMARLKKLARAEEES